MMTNNNQIERLSDPIFLCDLVSSSKPTKLNNNNKIVCSVLFFC